MNSSMNFHVMQVKRSNILIHNMINSRIKITRRLTHYFFSTGTTVKKFIFKILLALYE